MDIVTRIQGCGISYLNDTILCFWYSSNIYRKNQLYFFSRELKTLNNILETKDIYKINMFLLNDPKLDIPFRLFIMSILNKCCNDKVDGNQLLIDTFGFIIPKLSSDKFLQLITLLYKIEHCNNSQTPTIPSEVQDLDKLDKLDKLDTNNYINLNYSSDSIKILEQQLFTQVCTLKKIKSIWQVERLSPPYTDTQI